MLMRDQESSLFNASRFFAIRGAIDESKGEIVISGCDARHIKDVLRMELGGDIVVCDGEGKDFNCKIVSVERERVVAGIVSSEASKGEPPIKVCLFQAVPKGDKFDLVVQKCVEAGASEIVPVLTVRTLFKLQQGGKQNKLDRWNRISYEAAKQSGRGIVPVVNGFMSFSDAIKKAGCMSDMVVIPYERMQGVSLKSVLRGSGLQESGRQESRLQQDGLQQGRPQGSGQQQSVLSGGQGGTAALRSISVFIGPEGGFEQMEVDLAVESGAVAVSLGPRILRTETAGVVVLSAIMYELE